MARTKGSLGKHKKEKPIKEHKKKGRPKGSIKQKQKQEQHQIVNVNINSSRKKRDSSEEREGKKPKRKKNRATRRKNLSSGAIIFARRLCLQTCTVCFSRAKFVPCPHDDDRCTRRKRRRKK